MTGLLVSVRNATEAAIALSVGVDVIDVKEPTRGSLGAASADVVESVVEFVNGRATISAACGELRDLDVAAALLPRGVALAKVALAGCADYADWRGRWRDWALALPEGTLPVAVVYADHEMARSPRWQDVVALAADNGAAFVLVDTFDKSAGTLFEHWPASVIAACAREARAAGLGLVLAGSLAGEAVARAREFEPDYVAVRGAACRGGREGTLDAAAIGRLLATVRNGAVRDEQPNASAGALSRVEGRHLDSARAGRH